MDNRALKRDWKWTKNIWANLGKMSISSPQTLHKSGTDVTECLVAHLAATLYVLWDTSARREAIAIASIILEWTSDDH